MGEPLKVNEASICSSGHNRIGLDFLIPFILRGAVRTDAGNRITSGIPPLWVCTAQFASMRFLLWLTYPWGHLVPLLTFLILPLLLHIPRLPLHHPHTNPCVGQSVRHLWEPSPTEEQKKGSNGQQRVVRIYLAWKAAFSDVPWAQKFHWQLSIKSHFYFLYDIYGLVMQYQYMPMVSIYTTMYF